LRNSRRELNQIKWVVGGGIEATMMRARMNIRQQVYGSQIDIALPQRRTRLWHDYLLNVLHQWSILALRVALGLIFLWFGILKLFGTSPVMVILKQTFTFMPLLPFTIG